MPSPTSTRSPKSIARSGRRRSRSTLIRAARLHPQDQHQRNVRTRDEVIRREMRQLESAWYDGARIERSKCASSGLATSTTSTSRRPRGRRHGPGGRRGDGRREGHGQSARRDRLLQLRQAGVHASVSQQNIFGSGNALTAGINTSSVNRTIAVTFVEPYWTWTAFRAPWRPTSGT